MEVKRMADYGKTCLDCWCVHQALVRLGFKMEQIFVIVARNVGHEGLPCAHVELRAQGKSFTIFIERLDKIDPQVFLDAWTEFTVANNEHRFSDEECKKTWDEWISDHPPMPLVMGLLNKGFFFPRGMS